MATTDDQEAYYSSLPDAVRRNTVNMLSGRRFALTARQEYRFPQDLFDQAKNDPAALGKIATTFISDHYNNQVPRIMTLERYYEGDNDIHYWHSHKKPTQADNRIATGFPAYITNIRVGYRFGNPLKYEYNAPDGGGETAGDDLMTAIGYFNTSNDEPYHEKVLGKNASVTGRAYELLYVGKDETEPSLRAIDPLNAFVVYDTTVEQHSLFGVYYYASDILGVGKRFYVTIYTDSEMYTYEPVGGPSAELKPQTDNEHFFGAVPLTEFLNSDERMGDWEAKLDEIDARDKSLSEMANSQEDFNNAILMITGDFATDDQQVMDAHGQPMTDANGQPVMTKKPLNINAHDNYLWLKPAVTYDINNSPTAAQPNAQYLTKQTNGAEWLNYLSKLDGDIHKDTNTPDTSDQNFSANASGVAMAYKLWGSDQERVIQESLFLRGLMRRLRLLANYWQKKAEVSAASNPNNIQVTFTPNMPKNNAETVTEITALANVKAVSDETIQSMAEAVTGVKPEEEQKRLKEEADEAPKIQMPGDYPPMFTSADKRQQATQQSPQGFQTEQGASRADAVAAVAAMRSKEPN
ncbi:phage portal protein [Schleiferilactobacillus shenzhenensis]|uniref:Phage portal protein n=1 Tax=Schleiferilactobacillus shenzhenensis LY-73 TaxID=1231336 RepID=U4TKG9_9LACO|nr:phage portal protein [Schleiferilactobacillus shenzhenensis]ERL63850.1 hypothetical protein L248_2143 [Schleiferilactobacillus shenzhenensis LY-73]